MSTSTPSTSWPDAGLDPLVPPAGADLGEWNRRFSNTWRRSWRTLARIFLLTFAAPQVAAVVIVEQYAPGVAAVAGGLPLPATEVGAGVGIGLAAIGLTVLVMLAVLLTNAVGWAAGIWAVTQGAAGLPVSAGDALRAGLNRVWPMFGNYLLYLLLVIAGALACLVPGLYVAFAAALFSFVVVYERGRNPLVRSVSLVHRGLGVAAGRILLLFVLALLAQFAVGVVSGVAGMAPTETSAGQPVPAAVLDSLVGVPVSMALLVGLLLTYTQLRARDEHLTTGALWAAANPE
jgi:hypothetical protein